MATSKLHYYEQRSEEVRTLADLSDHEETRDALHRVANGWESLAMSARAIEEAEAMLTRWSA
jgi:hypothetical protein